MRRRRVTLAALAAALAGAGLAWQAHGDAVAARATLARLREQKAEATDQERLLQARLHEATLSVNPVPPEAGKANVASPRVPSAAEMLTPTPELRDIRKRIDNLSARIRFRAFATSRRLSNEEFESLLALCGEWTAAQEQLQSAVEMEPQERTERHNQSWLDFRDGLTVLLGTDGVAAYDRYAKSLGVRGQHVEPVLGVLVSEGVELPPDLAERLTNVFTLNSAVTPGRGEKTVVDWDGVLLEAEAVLPARGMAALREHAANERNTAKLQALLDQWSRVAK